MEITLVPDQLADLIIKNALKDEPKLHLVEDTLRKAIVRECLQEMYEHKAHAKSSDLSAQEVDSIKNILVISGAGSVYEPQLRQDNEAFKKMAEYNWSDARRIYHAFDIARRMAMRRAQPHYDGNPSNEDLASILQDFAPNIIYNGPPGQDYDLEHALSSGNIFFPQNKIQIIHPKSDFVRTWDQVQEENLPKFKVERGDRLALVADYFHYPRILRMFNKTKSLPSGLTVQLFPVPLPKGDYRNAECIEATGCLVYLQREKCTRKPLPYIY